MKTVVSDKVFVCYRCSNRLKKKGIQVAFEWTLESLREMKISFFKKMGRKPYKRVILTTCMGYCPESKVSYQDAKGLNLSEAGSYSAHLSRNDIYKKFFS